MTTCRDKETAALLREVRAAGGHVQPTRRGHWRISHHGVPVYTVSGTGSDRRGLANARAALRRAGLVKS